MPNNTPILLQNKNSFDRLIDLAMVGAIGYGVYLLYNQNQQKKQELKIVDTPTTRQASQFYAAMNPSGIKLFNMLDGADQLKIMEIAHSVTDWKSVIEEYRKSYKASLLDDLRTALTPSRYDEINQIVARMQNEKTSNPYVIPANIFLFKTTQEVNIKLGIPGYTQPIEESKYISKINFKNEGEITKRFVRTITDSNKKFIRHERWYLLKVPGYLPTEFSWEAITNSFTYHQLWFPEKWLTIRQ